MTEPSQEMLLRTALAYKARYDQRPSNDKWVLLMRQQNEAEIAQLRAAQPDRYDLPPNGSGT